MQQSLKQRAGTDTRQANAVALASAYRVPRYRVTLVCEERGESSPETVRDSTSAATIVRPHFSGLDREHFLVLGLDAKNRIIGINVVSVGSLSLAIVHPREVFKPLILMNAAAWLKRWKVGSCNRGHAKDQEAMIKTRLLAGQEPGPAVARVQAMTFRHWAKIYLELEEVKKIATYTDRKLKVSHLVEFFRINHLPLLPLRMWPCTVSNEFSTGESPALFVRSQYCGHGAFRVDGNAGISRLPYRCRPSTMTTQH